MIGASEIADRLGLRRPANGKGYAGDCPACHYRDGLRLNDKGGRALWCCASCGSGPDLTAAVLGTRAPTAPSLATTARDDPAKVAKALAMWEAALPIQGSNGERYLAGRALPLPDGGALRFLPDARHLSGARAGAMIALATDATGQGRAIHRTFLAPGGAGKAQLDPPRAALAPIGGMVARICRWTAGPLVIGEGIETSLSAGLLMGAPAWAALSAGNMKAVALPDDCREVVIAADHDFPGQRAAWAAADAFMAQGRRVQVIRPDNPGDDFNDLLQRQRARETTHAE